MKHLTPKMFARYFLRDLSKEELAQADTHLESCEKCKDKLRSIERAYALAQKGKQNGK